MFIEPLTQYKILISAPAGDGLRDVCHALVDIAADAGHYARPVNLDLSQANGDEIEEAIRASDVFVAIARSPTEQMRKACELAIKNSKPVLVLLIGPDARVEDVSVLKRVINLDYGTGSVHLLNDETSLKEKYLGALNRLVRILDTAGRSSKAETEMSISNPFVRRFIHLARRWDTINARCGLNADLKRSVSAFVLDHYFAMLLGAGVKRWFLESGSSIAYLTEVLLANWPRLAERIDEIETNNILTYLELVRTESIRFNLFPSGRPEDKYGASLGALRSLAPPVRPTSMGHPIEGDARFEVEKIKRHFAQLYATQGIIFGATSGIELDARSPFPGPHVGSYHNMLFKRALLEAGKESRVPVIIMADGDKVPYSFKPDKCFPICDPEFSWPTVVQEVPLAIACAFRKDNKDVDAVMARLRELGFKHQESERAGQVPWCVIASNDRFWALRTEWIRASAQANEEEQDETAPNAIESPGSTRKTVVSFRP